MVDDTELPLPPKEPLFEMDLAENGGRFAPINSNELGIL
jgi:hypothetical protein